MYHKHTLFFLLLTFSFIFVNMGLVSSFSGSGDGSIGNPFQITNCSQLQEIVTNTTANYTLINNINCSDTINWNNGTGFISINFSGIFNGNNYSINNLYINRSNASLFYQINSNSIISNLNLINYTLFGVFASSISVNNTGKIINCHSNGEINTSTYYQSSSSYIGGLSLYNYGIIESSSSEGYIVISAYTNPSIIYGGLVGYNYNVINNSYANVISVGIASAGSYTSNGGSMGGLVGVNYGNISQSYSIGSLIFEGTNNGFGGFNGGGFVGWNYGKIVNCYSKTNVTLNSGGDSSLYMGGFAGATTSSSNISRCYSIGKLSPSSVSGSFCGIAIGGFTTGLSTNVNNSFWDINTSSMINDVGYIFHPLTTNCIGANGGATGKTTINMKNQSTFTDWNFNGIWGINSLINEGYPYLGFSSVSLDSPVNSSSQKGNVTFICSGIFQNDLVNSTLQIWNVTSGVLYGSLTQDISGLSNTSTFDFNFTNEGTYLWNCLYEDNNSLQVSSPLNYTLYINLFSPAITLETPLNNQYINYQNNINFSFIPISNNLSTCQLWGNFSGSWSKSYTWNNPLSENISSTLLSLSDNYYKWNVWCNNSFNNSGFSPNNFTIGVDTISPVILDNISITTTKNTQTFLFRTNISDTNLNLCQYTILDENLSVNGLNSNISFTCNQLSSGTTFGYGNWTLLINSCDIVNHCVQQNNTFSTTYVSSGGGNPPPVNPITRNPVVSSGQPVLTEGNWTMETELGGNYYQFNMIQNSSRNRDLLFENLGVTDRTITMSCVEVSGSNNLCDGITFIQNTFDLPVQKSVKTSNGFNITIPDDFQKGKYVVNLVGTDESGNVGVITLQVTITSSISITGAITKLFGKTSYGVPYFLFFLLVAFIFGVLSNFIIFKPLKLPSALSVLVGLIFGIIFLLLPI